MRLAVRHATLAATAGLLRRFGGCKSLIDLMEIVATLDGRPLERHLPVDVDELEHAFRGHCGASLQHGGYALLAKGICN